MSGNTAMLKSTPNAAMTLFSNPAVETILLDCDGVVYSSGTVLPNSREMIVHLTAIGKRVLFVTNSSGKSRKDMRDKLRGALELPDLTLDQMVPSCWVAASHIASHLPPSKKCFVIGGQGIVDELALLGVECVRLPPDALLSDEDSIEDAIENYVPDPSVGCVVVGMDTSFTYSHVAIASLYLAKPSVLFVSCNQDPFDILPSGRHQPAAGVMVGSIERASNRPATDCGKPSSVLFKKLCEEYGVNATNAMMVGDRMDTDVAFGFRHGLRTVLVLSGCAGTREIVDCLREGYEDKQGQGCGDDYEDNYSFGERGVGEGLVVPGAVVPYFGFGLEFEGWDCR
jgi:phosphoglycolate/pyridoxal phosphate phosphatase family enzyme